MDIRGKHVVVTGGANGIGEAMCRRFAEDGARGVVVADLDGERAASVAAEIDGLAVTVDVSDENSIGMLAAAAQTRFGAIDVWCSNAGVGGKGELEAAPEVWQRSWQVNLMAHVYAAKIVVPSMVERGEGYLVQTVSAGGLLTGPASPHYVATKHAAIGLAEWLSMKYGTAGVRVSCVCPQAVDTQMVRSTSDPAALAALKEIGTLISPDDVAESVIVGMRDETFLILPNPEVLTYFQRKANDYDRWLQGMRKMMDRAAAVKAAAQVTK